MKTLNGQELQIFRAGNYGPKGTYTPADLQQIASDYNPSAHEAPLCIGHPTTNAPAFGWLKSVRADGDLLFGTFEEVPPAMDTAVRQGAFKKRSIAFRTLPDGKLQIRHVGYLGAMDPHIQGLADAQFSDEQFQEVEFSGEEMTPEEQQQSISEAVRKFFAGLFPKSDPASFSAADLSAMESRISANFAAQLAAKDTEISALRTEFSAQKAAADAGSVQARITRAIDGLKARKHWLPAFDAMQVPAIFAALGASTTVDIEFSSERDGKTVRSKLDPVAALEKFLDGLGKIVPEGHQFNAATITVDGAPKTVETGGGTTVNAGSIAFDTDIKAYMAEHKVAYPVAYAALTRDGKSSATYAAAKAGAV